MYPTAGRVLLNGNDINERGYQREQLRHKVGIVFQFPEQQLFEMTVERDVAFGPQKFGLPPVEIEERTRWALEAVGFDYEKVRGLSPLGLSGGEKRKAAIAGVLAMKPEVLILDEPIAGLDPVTRKDYMRFIHRLNQDGITILMVSHNVDELSEYAGRIIVLDHGRLIMDGTAKEIFRDVDKLKSLHLGVSQSREVADLLQRRGISIPQDIIKYDELLAALEDRLCDGVSNE
jgi:energy-coupling factor transport system ATP-binding protein